MEVSWCGGEGDVGWMREGVRNGGREKGNVPSCDEMREERKVAAFARFGGYG